MHGSTGNSLPYDGKELVLRPLVRPRSTFMVNLQDHSGTFIRDLAGQWHGRTAPEYHLNDDLTQHLEEVFQQSLAEGTCITAVKQQDGSTIYTKSWREV